MVIETPILTCYHCESDQLVRNGHAENGKQRYRCRACGRQSRAHPTQKGYSDAQRTEILHATQERASLRGVARTFGVSRNTITTWIKKATELPALHTTVFPPDPCDSARPILELDEV